MNRHLTRIAAAVAVASVLTATGAGLAAAATTPVPSADQSGTITAIHDLTAASTEIAGSTTNETALAQGIGTLRDVLNHVRGCGAGTLADPADARAAQIQQILPIPGVVDPALLSSLLDLVNTLVTALYATLPGVVPSGLLPTPAVDPGSPVDIPDLPGPVTLPGTGADTNLPDVTAPGDTTATPGAVTDDVTAVPGDVAAVPSDVSAATGDVSAVPGAVTGDTSAATGDVSAVPGDAVDVVGTAIGVDSEQSTAGLPVRPDPADLLLPAAVSLPTLRP
ncbi:hypothetical protein [Actinokineospora inagensis]|uniref:hypothetical protein n=1 Tax=Actinokineospora inagensis TaxID=103730 RepID=UPI00042076CF|nr:hypothetical protein [Actinokineospora inagensis]